MSSYGPAEGFTTLGAVLDAAGVLAATVRGGAPGGVDAAVINVLTGGLMVRLRNRVRSRGVAMNTIVSHHISDRI
jgi:hypothetical protein